MEYGYFKQSPLKSKMGKVFYQLQDGYPVSMYMYVYVCIHIHITDIAMIYIFPMLPYNLKLLRLSVCFLHGSVTLRLTHIDTHKLVSLTH